MNFDQASWERLWAQFSTQPDSPRWFNELARLYNEPGRHYHNAQHISDCLREFQQVESLARNRVAVELAIWLHDAIYDPHRSDNEEQSSRFAETLLKAAGAETILIAGVTELIMATKHQATPSAPDAQLMVDIDLSILGQTREHFWKYESQIRQEYTFVREEIFRSKRSQILDGFLGRSRIYQTPWFQNHYELQARSNLTESVRRLRTD